MGSKGDDVSNGMDDYFAGSSTKKPMEKRAPGQGAREQALQIDGEKSGLKKVLESVLDAPTDDRSWRRGAEGEELVGRRLDRLNRDKWRVLHDITIGERGANLDHLLIGTPGVFTLNTKKLNGKITISDSGVYQNGRSHRMLEKSIAEAAKVQRRLSAAIGSEVHVRPVLVIVQSLRQPDPKWAGKPEGCSVLFSTALPLWILKQRAQVLTPFEVGKVEWAARQPETWAPERPGR